MAFWDFDWLFGGTDNTQTGTTTTTAAPPQWLTDMLRGTLTNAQNLSGENYVQYGAPRVAPLAPGQQQAINYAQNNLQTGMMTMPSAGTWVNQAMLNPMNPAGGGIAQYFNPYSDYVTQNTVSEMGRQNEILKDQDRARATMQGAYGGSRTALLESERDRNFLNMVGQVTDQSRMSNWQNALGQYNTQQQNLLQGANQFMNLGVAQRGITDAGITSLMNASTMGQANQQQNLDVAYQDFLNQRQWPYNQLGWFLDRLSGAPTGQSQTSQTSGTTPGPSVAGQVGGLGLGAAGILSLLQ